MTQPSPSQSAHADRPDAVTRLSVRIELYENPFTPDGYRGALTRSGFTGLTVPTPGDRLQGTGGFGWGAPFPTVAYVEHWLDHPDDLEPPEACQRDLPVTGWHGRDPAGATVVAHADATDGERVREAYEQQGWRWHPADLTRRAER